MKRTGPPRLASLWSQAGAVNQLMLDYTIGDDRVWDAHLLPWDVIGSLGHIEGLRASGLLSGAEHRRLRQGLRQALGAVARGRLTIGTEHEDAHSAVEAWLTRRLGSTGQRVHTGRSRNDQVACDLRLLLKDRVLAIHAATLGTARGLLGFATRHRTVLWPGYTHQRRAMPSSAGLWAAAHAEGLIETLETTRAIWQLLDRSPLGSAAGYGVPLPLDREAAAEALGFGGLVHSVGTVQNGRGKLEAAVLFWCAQLGHDLSRLSGDVVLWSGEEFGFLRLPEAFATGSSIMPQKRNPDLFELTRARAASVEGHLAEIMAIKSKLTSGYHRDFQLLKAPLLQGVARTLEMVTMMGVAVPALEVDAPRAKAALEGGILATDLVMRSVERGVPFRRAYRDVAAALKRGDPVPPLSSREIVERRTSTGGIGRLGLDVLSARAREQDRWAAGERNRFERALSRLRGR